MMTPPPIDRRDAGPTPADRGHAQGRAPPAPGRLAPGRHRAGAGPDPRVDAPTDVAAMSRRSSRPSRAAVPGRAPRARSTCRSRCSRTRRPSNGPRRSWSRPRPPSGVRYVEIRWGPRAPHPARPRRSPTGSPPSAAAAAESAARTGTVVRLICTALRSHDPELQRRAGRDRGRGSATRGSSAGTWPGREGRSPIR